MDEQELEAKFGVIMEDYYQQIYRYRWPASYARGRSSMQEILKEDWATLPQKEYKSRCESALEDIKESLGNLRKSLASRQWSSGKPLTGEVYIHTIEKNAALHEGLLSCFD